MIRTSLIMAGLALGLSACGGGGGGGGGVATPPAPPPTPAFSAQFGPNFSTAFEATPNGEPRPIASGDVIAANPAAEPVPVR